MTQNNQNFKAAAVGANFKTTCVKLVLEVLQSDLTRTFEARLELNKKISAKSVGSGVDVERLKGQVEMLQDIGKVVPNLREFATRGFVSTAGEGFLRSFDVVGSSLHHTVLAVGKFIGFEFRPWQAVNIAKDIANVAMFVGPILGAVSVAVDICKVQQESEQDRKLAEARREITSQFIAIAKDLESQIEAQLREVEAQVYGEIEKQIAQARQKEESAVAASNTWVKQLAEIRKDFELILQYITKATESPVA